jgi:hypothetical protein
MSKSGPAKNPSTPAAPSAADAASAAGNQSSQVGAGKQPGAGSSSAPGSASNASEPKPGDVQTGTQARPDGEPPAGPARKATRKPKLHPRAAEADIPAAVLTAACGDSDFTDVLGARRYPDRWVLVLMSAKDVRKFEVPL